MGKLMNWIGIMSGVTLVFYLGGIIQDTPSSTLLTLVLNPENIQDLSLGLLFTSISLTVLGVAATLFARQQGSDFYLMIPLVELLFVFGWDFAIIYQEISSTSSIGNVIALMIFGPILIMYALSVFEWWRGVET